MTATTTRSVRLVTPLAALALAALPAGAQSRLGGSSWVEAGGFYHHVSNDYGDWRGGYARAVVAGRRDAWYLDGKAQRAFGDDGLYGSLANVHTFSSRFYTQVGVGGGTGTYVLPDLREDLALNFKLGRSGSVVATVGETYVVSKSVYRDKAFFASLSWYASAGVLVEAGGRVNWSNPGSVRTARASAALTLGRLGRTLVTLRGGAGGEGYQLLAPPVTPRNFQSREASGVLRQWVSRRFGFVLQGDWYHNPFYTRTGLSAGLFRAW